jgi:hypothetical protein
MSAMTAVETRQADMVPSTEAGVLQGVCDHLDCPAPAMKRIDLFSQDFYFCNHHWSEIANRLPGDDGAPG